MTTVTIWTSIPEVPDYLVSDRGDIVSLKGAQPKQLRPSCDRLGYQHITLRQNRQKHSWKVHRLVLMAFDRLPEPGEVGRHLDGNPRNNHISNLAWGTAWDNVQDARKHGTFREGENSPLHKLTAEQVSEIRRTYGTCKVHESAKHYGVAISTITQVALGYRWASCPTATAKPYRRSATGIPYVYRDERDGGIYGRFKWKKRVVNVGRFPTVEAAQSAVLSARLACVARLQEQEEV